MARSAQTELAVLGALSVEPMTGYAIREAIKDVLGHFWSESFGQIYPTLAALEEGGLVRRQVGGSARSTPFELTGPGRDRLVALLGLSIQSTPARNGMLLRLFFGRLLGPAACRRLVETARAEAEERLADYARIRADITADLAHAAEQPFWLLTVSAGEHTARATVTWAEEALAVLDGLPDEDAGTGA